MDVELTPDHKAFVRHAIDTGRLHHEGEAVQEDPSLWENLERARLELIAKLDLAETSLEGGEGRLPRPIDPDEVRCKSSASYKAISITKHHRWTYSLAALLVLPLCTPHRAPAQMISARPKPEFWIGAIDPVVQQDRHAMNPSDYMKIFQPPVDWPIVAKRTSTLEISTQYVLRGTPQQHQALIDGLRVNHLKLAGQFGVEEASPNPACGGQMEGRGGPANAGGVARRVHDLGLPLEYLDMDEPLTWGREAPRNKCPETVEKLAQTAAAKVALYRQLFPAIKVNLIDAVGGPFKTQVQDEIQFVDLLGKLGVHIDFFLADVQWSSTWQPNFEQLATKLHARGIKVGLYCNGLLSSNSDLTWDRDSVANCTNAGHDPKIAPDLFMIGTWSPYPTKIFPEDKPGTLTHIGKQLMEIFP